MAPKAWHTRVAVQLLWGALTICPVGATRQLSDVIRTSLGLKPTNSSLILMAHARGLRLPDQLPSLH